MKPFISNQILPEISLKDSLYLWAQIPFIFSKKSLDFASFFGSKNYILTNTARSALGILIQALSLPKDKKIGIPAFCCCVMATPFLEAGYKIEWIDTDENGLVDPEDFQKKADKICLVIVPHIFGQEAPVKEICDIADSKGILVIEDCAHYLPNVSEFVGQSSDFRLYSFGREKVLSCVSGGALVYGEAFKEAFSQATIPRASFKWTIQHLLHPLVYALSLPWWYQGGKFLPWFFRKIKLLPLAVTPAEKSGQEDIQIEKLSFPHQKLLQKQIDVMNKKFDQKRAVSKQWQERLSHFISPHKISTTPLGFRVILKSLNPEEKQIIIETGKKEGFDLREWDGTPISPKGTNLSVFGYTPGQCPKAETFSQSYLTLPTHQRVPLKSLEKFTENLRLSGISKES